MFKLTCVFLLYNINVNLVIGHEDRLFYSSSSDADKIEEILRRKNDFLNREWQYEGLPIDAEAFRRSLIEQEREIEIAHQTTPKRTTTTPVKKSIHYRRIFNAESQVTVQDHPYMAALLVNDQLWCGAAIVAQDSVITAAHCLQLQHNNRFFREYYKMLSVRVGSNNATHGGHLYQVTEIFFHPNYKPDNLDFNFAILKLDKNITMDEYGAAPKAIELTSQTALSNDQKIDFLGWGSDMDSGPGGQVLLQKITLPVYDTLDCKEVYGRDLVTSSNFCAGYITVAKNVCNHDAGGPAVLKGQLVGILSFSNKRCDEPDKPAVFSSVAAVAPWINKVLLEKKQETIRIPPQS